MPRLSKNLILDGFGTIFGWILDGFSMMLCNFEVFFWILEGFFYLRLWVFTRMFLDARRFRLSHVKAIICYKNNICIYLV